MLKANRKNNGSGQILELSGEVDESLDLAKIIGTPPADLTLNCRGITRANSTGIGLWIRYFQGPGRAIQKFKLVECSPVIVEAINMISNFHAHAVVESIFVPFVCGACSTEYLDLHPTTELKKFYPDPPASKCPKCKAPGTIDDSPMEYLAFLARK